jgi:uncharacterized protein
MKLIIVLFFACAPVAAQTDWQRWNAKDVSYIIEKEESHNYNLDNSSFGMKALSVIRNGYYYFISDLDGDNCPFSPTCSSFYLSSVKATNILKGTLMFSDRFLRDLNFVKSTKHYHILGNGKLFDPSSNYTLNLRSIKFSPNGN